MKLYSILLFFTIISSCRIQKSHNLDVSNQHLSDSIRGSDEYWAAEYEKQYLDSVSKANKYWQNEKNKVKDCRKLWLYSDLMDTLDLKVLDYTEHFNYDLMSFPNFIICATDKDEIIGILDNSFEGTIVVGETITVVPNKLSIEKRNRLNLEPCLKISPDEKINNLQCILRNIYFGNIACNFSSPESKSRRLSEGIFVFNPDFINKDLAVEINLLKKTNATLKVMNMGSKTVMSIQQDLIVGKNQISLDVSELAKGLYMLNISNGDELNFTQTFRKK